jgi:hypothetical protein
MGRLGERREDRGMITKEQFFQYYRSDKYSNELTRDEKIEVFLMSLEGSSDITIDLLFALCNEYDVDLEKLLEGENG